MARTTLALACALACALVVALVEARQPSATHIHFGKEVQVTVGGTASASYSQSGTPHPGNGFVLFVKKYGSSTTHDAAYVTIVTPDEDGDWRNVQKFDLGPPHGNPAASQIHTYECTSCEWAEDASCGGDRCVIQDGWTAGVIARRGHHTFVWEHVNLYQLAIDAFNAMGTPPTSPNNKQTNRLKMSKDGLTAFMRGNLGTPGYRSVWFRVDPATKVWSFDDYEDGEDRLDCLGNHQYSVLERNIAIDGDYTAMGMEDCKEVWLYKRVAAGNWDRVHIISGTGTNWPAWLDMSGDVIAVGDWPSSESSSSVGFVRVYERDAGLETWSEIAELKDGGWGNMRGIGSFVSVADGGRFVSSCNTWDDYCMLWRRDPDVQGLPASQGEYVTIMQRGDHSVNMEVDSFKRRRDSTFSPSATVYYRLADDASFMILGSSGYVAEFYVQPALH